MDRSTLTKIALTAAIILGGGGFLVYSSVGHAQHYRMVDELVGDGFDKWEGKELKVHGYVEAGSIVENVVGQVQRRTFVLQKNGKKIRIFSSGPKPDTFKDRAEIVATGHVVPARTLTALAVALHVAEDSSKERWVVEASDLMAKCPEHYDADRAPTAHVNTDRTVQVPKI